MMPSEAAKEFGLVALGGAVGSMARYGVTLAVATQKFTGPWALIIVNLVGSFVIGLVAGNLVHRPNPSLQLLVVVGILGGFTTFSSFSLENANLLRTGAIGVALLNILGQVVIGTVFAALGYALTAR